MPDYQRLHNSKDIDDELEDTPPIPRPRPRSSSRSSLEQRRETPKPDLASAPESNGTVVRDKTDMILEIVTKNQLETAALRAEVSGLKRELKHVKFNCAKTCIMAVAQTKQFSETIAKCIDEAKQFDFEKFSQVIHNPEPRSLGAVIQRLMKANELSNEDLIEIMKEALDTWEPAGPEPMPPTVTTVECDDRPAKNFKKGMSTSKKVMIGSAVAAGVAGAILLLVLCWNPPALAAALSAKAIVGLTIGGSAGVGFGVGAGAGAYFME